jgi:hypothetical protein
MTYLSKIIGAPVPIGGLIPVSNAVDVSGSSYLYADGSDVLAADYPALAPRLPAATSATLRQLPVISNFSTVGYGNGLYIAASAAFGTANRYAFTLSYSTDGINWTLRTVIFPNVNADSANKYIAQIKYLNGAWYLAMSGSTTGFNPPSTSGGFAASSGELFKSLDGGITWTQIFSAIGMANVGVGPYDYVKCFSLRYINGVYAAVCGSVSQNGGGYPFIYTSTDAITWTPRQPTNFASMSHSDIAFGAGLYVAVGYQYTISSPDLVTWTARTNAQTAGWTGVAFGAGVFVSVQGFTNTATTTVGYSTNGTTWSAQTIPSGRYQRVIFADSKFVAIGYGVCATSPDGITWTARTVPNFNWVDLDYSSPNGFVAVASTVNSTSPTVTITSPDGITWTSTSVNLGAKCTNVVYGTGFGFVTIDANTAFAMSSPDGLTWTRASTISAGYNYIATNAAGTVAVGVNVSNIQYSTNLATWTTAISMSGFVCYSVKWLNNKFVALSYTSSTYFFRGHHSLDGITWVPISIDKGTSDSTFMPISSAYGNGTYVAVGLQSYISAGSVQSFSESRMTASSTDGMYWNTANQLPVAGIWSAVEYGNGVFVALTTKNQRTIGINVNPHNTSYVQAAASSNVGDILGVSGRACAVSTNGIDWVLSYMPVVGEWNSLTFNGHVFIAVDGLSKSYAISKDGYNWVLRPAPEQSNWSSIASNPVTNVSVAVSGDVPVAGNAYVANAIQKYGSTMRITESTTSVTLPYVRPNEGLNYLVRVK